MLVQNLNEVILKPEALCGAVLRFATSLGRDITPTIFLLFSHQSPTSHSTLAQLLVRQVLRQGLWLVVVDQVHLQIQQDMLFCGMMCELINDFFSKMFSLSVSRQNPK